MAALEQANLFAVLVEQSYRQGENSTVWRKMEFVPV
jgi:hypothetical protein